MSDADLPSSVMLALKERIARLEAEVDILRRRGTPADVTMLGAIVVGIGECFTAACVERQALKDARLASAIAAALGPGWDAHSLGWRLRRISGGYVRREETRERDGRTWWVSETFAHFEGSVDTSSVADDRAA